MIVVREKKVFDFLHTIDKNQLTMSKVLTTVQTKIKQPT